MILGIRPSTTSCEAVSEVEGGHWKKINQTFNACSTLVLRLRAALRFALRSG